MFYGVSPRSPKAYILHSPVPALTTEGACRVLADEWGAASERYPGWLQAG